MAINKKYQVKIYEPNGSTLIETVKTSQIRNEISFNSKINSGLSELSLVLKRDFDNFDEEDSIKAMNIVRVFEFDENNTDGRQIYIGFISQYEPFLTRNDEGVRLIIIGLQALLTQLYYKNGSSFDVSKSNEANDDILKEIIDQFQKDTTTGIVARYNFNEGSGSTLIDRMNGLNGTLINSPTYVTGIEGTALDFNGSSQYVSVSDNALLDLTTGMSVSCWFNLDVLQTGGLFVKMSNSPSSGYRLMIEGGNYVRGDIYTDSIKILGSPALSGVTTGQWYLATMTFDGSTFKLYMNGVLVDSVSASGSITTNALAVKIGQLDSGGLFLDGKIDETRVYDRALSSSEVFDLYKNPAKSGFIIFYDDEIADTGTLISPDFSRETQAESINKVSNLSGGTYFWRLERDGEFVFKSKPLTATHTFTIGKDIDKAISPKSSEELINDVTLFYTSSSINAQDATSISNYGKHSKVFEDLSIDNVGDAQLFVDQKIAEFKDLKINNTFNINNRYDFETIKVGDTCKIRNLSEDSQLFNDNMLIVSIDYSPDFAVIVTDTIENNFGKQLQIYNES